MEQKSTQEIEKKNCLQSMKQEQETKVQEVSDVKEEVTLEEETEVKDTPVIEEKRKNRRSNHS